MKNYRCKILGVESDPHTHETNLLVLIRGIKNQTIVYSPSNLVLDDAMLREFSPFDARAITFYALNQTTPLVNYPYTITAQEFIHGKTIFILKKSDGAGELRKSAQALYASTELLNQFNRANLITIISTAIQEQTMDDLTNSST